MTVLVLIGLVGATLIVVRGSIFVPLQRLAPFFRCSRCLGFWVGAVAGATGFVVTGHGRALDALIVGCAISALALLTDAVTMTLIGWPDEEEVTKP